MSFHAVVIGGGLSGLATSILLRRAGLEVLVVEEERFPRARVGESLDWAAPGLLESLGVSLGSLVRDQSATYKRGLRIINPEGPGGTSYCAGPKDWFGGWPFWLQTTTLRVDRPRLDARLLELALESGVTVEWDRVTKLEAEANTVRRCTTSRGSVLTASWFLDASGRARVLGRALRIPVEHYGKRKVGVWTYFDTTPSSAATTVYMDNAAPYLKWIWEIPVSPRRTSVGCIVPADQFRDLNESGGDTWSAVAGELSRHERFARLLADNPTPEFYTCSYRSYVSREASGPNWFLLGEAAALPDPLTANGVTAALRHAHEATRLIVSATRGDSGRGTIPVEDLRLYTARVRMMGHAFNHNIERAIYDRSMRAGLGPLRAEKLYTWFAYPANALYSRHPPCEGKSVLRFEKGLRAVEAWIDVWARIGAVAATLRGGLGTRPEAPVAAGRDAGAPGTSG